MDIGLNYAFGSNPKHDPGLLRQLVQSMESLGFDSLWMPEHVVSFPTDHYQSRYPYSDDGAVPWRGDLYLHDPLLVAVAAAQHTRRLRFGSGIVILPQRPPLLTAKELMTLDHLTSGRFEFGVGGGWSAEEYAALGVSFAQRGKRFDEYITAIRTAWQHQPASFHGEFVGYDQVVIAPPPLTPGGPRMFIGGSSEAAMSRAARLGDGWFGHWTGASDPGAELETLADARHRAGTSEREDFQIKVSLVFTEDPNKLSDRISSIESMGVHELVLVVPVRTKCLDEDLELWAQAANLTA